MSSVSFWLKTIVALGLLWFVFHTGEKTEEAKWVKLRLAEAVQNAKVVADANEKVRALESHLQVVQDNARDALQEKIDEERNFNNDTNKLYATIRKLRFERDSLQSSKTREDTVIASTLECNGKKITELSPEVFEYLSDKFRECDEIVDQLSVAQDLIVEYHDALTESQ